MTVNLSKKGMPPTFGSRIGQTGHNPNELVL